ncbi:MAG: ferredoxin-type protein NapH [Sphingobacteriales bacterium]|jgi:ferredoxin-type protein NapH
MIKFPNGAVLAENRSFDYIKTLGIGFSLMALSILIGLFFSSDFTLTADNIRSVVSSEIQQESVLSMIPQEKLGEPLGKIDFLSVVNNSINSANESFRAKQEWDNVIYGESDKVMSLARMGISSPIQKWGTAFFWLTFMLGFAGTLIVAFAKLKSKHAGINNDNIFFKGMGTRGFWAILLSLFLIAFYVLLYWYPAYIIEWIILVDPIALVLSGGLASQWFFYGFVYTLAIVGMGIKFMVKYRHNKYQLFRTFSVMFFQTAFAFAIPNILGALNMPAVDLKNIWPLDYSFFFEYRLDALIDSGMIGYFMMFWGFALMIIGVPLFTFFFGKRWYCSWVCGCGGLAETAGDDFRHLSDKSLNFWKVERILIHSVLVFSVVMTVGVVYTYLTNSSTLFGINTYTIRSVYGFGVGSVFAGVIGTGFYPVLGNRSWCRMGCPLAAYLGLIQRLRSKFRITTNGAQCISCGNCSTYCEMGIDVKWYAQRQQPIVRSSCVGCGICAAVCPRGVLSLEVKDVNGRLDQYTKPEEFKMVEILKKSGGEF